ncbi:hypothetical protein ABL78_2121 [Leptomonas seymouri]|uniref:C2HC/C3H-type domain-containing protein n=1 Tax=Leptomonas seymouri TaxID=5684 RepID=A0A0N1IM20_LEPSE|nr:hypothetical protein ABL78_2121 [Leptomonas seymouri]|eukprot:KPI88742.1 hypothetical protein ABL78_2121 [Leptomonas seymouri]
MMRDGRHAVSDTNLDGPALLNEQALLLSESTPSDINFLQFLKFRLSAQQRATAQRNYWQRVQQEVEGTPGGAAHRTGRNVTASSTTSTAVLAVDTEAYPASPFWNVQTTPVRTPAAVSAAGSNSVNSNTMRSERSYEHAVTTHNMRSPMEGSTAYGGNVALGPLQQYHQQQLFGSHPASFENMPASAAKRAMPREFSAFEPPYANDIESRAAALDEKPATASGKPQVPAGVDDMKDVKLEPCPHCGRTFAPDRLERHAITCERQQMTNPRPKTDGRDRRASIASASSHGKAERASATSIKSTPTKTTATAATSSSIKTEKWRRQSAQLRSALTGTSTVANDRVQCPNFGRRFAEDTAARQAAICRAKEDRHL